MKIGTKVSTVHGGKVHTGIIVGRHGSAEYYSIRLENGECIYRWIADIAAL